MREDVGKMRYGMRKPGEAQICFPRLLFDYILFSSPCSLDLANMLLPK